MAFFTPEKEYCRIELTPTTKEACCLLCGEKKINRKDRFKIVQKGAKTELCFLIEKLLNVKIDEKHQNESCCRNCARKLNTVDKSVSMFKENYFSTLKQFQTTHGKIVSKRLSSDCDTQPSSKRSLLFHSSDADREVPSTSYDQLSEIAEIMRHGNVEHAARKLSKHPYFSKSVEDNVFGNLQKEIVELSSKSTGSILRKIDKSDLESFSFKQVEDEWKTYAPTFHRFIRTVTTNPRAEKRNVDKKGDALLPARVSAGSKLLSLYNRDMSSLKYLNDVILLKGGLKKSAFSRLQSSSDCHSYQMVILKADEISQTWDTELLEWQKQCQLDKSFEDQIVQQIDYLSDTIELLENQQCDSDLNELIIEKSDTEQSLKRFRSTMHPGYYFVGDNCDMVTKVRTMTSAHQNRDEHMYQMCAYLNRVTGNDKDDSKPLQEAASANFAQLIPGPSEKEELLSQFTFLVARKWVQYIPYFKPYVSVLPMHLEHEHMKETREKTERINMGVLKKNECKNEDMVDIIM